jgi:hypothetical protein
LAWKFVFWSCYSIDAFFSRRTAGFTGAGRV